MKEDEHESGQTTVEFAMVIPVIAVFLLLIAYAAVVVREHVLVANASRAAARELSVNSDASDALSIAHESAPGSRVTYSRPSQGQYLWVSVESTVRAPLPLIGEILPDITLHSTTKMRVEK